MHVFQEQYQVHRQQYQVRGQQSKNGFLICFSKKLRNYLKIKVSVSVISLSLPLRLITLTSTLIIPDITKTSSNNCLIIFTFQNLLLRRYHLMQHIFVTGTGCKYMYFTVPGFIRSHKKPFTYQQ